MMWCPLAFVLLVVGSQDSGQGSLRAHATVVQDPYMFGYESVRILAALARGDESVLPDNDDKVHAIPVKIIRKDSVKEFWDNLKELTKGG